MGDSFRPDSPWSTASAPAVQGSRERSIPTRFPHTRAQLAAISRQYRPLESYDDDPDFDESSHITTALVNKVASLLADEREDELKSLIKENFGPSIDDDELSQHVLDLMHRHRDDVDNIPFLYLTPTRRPLSRPSSRASTHSARLIPNRPDTPTSAPGSPLAMLYRRPHTPLTSPLGGLQSSNSYITARSESPGSSPILTHAQFASSLPASPISSPRILNAKASEFRPIPRPLSAASSNPGSLAALRADTPSPDLWAHNPQRPTSKLAIAAPLTPDSSYMPRSVTPSSLRTTHRPDDDDEDEDPFDPFASQNARPSFHPIDHDAQWAAIADEFSNGEHYPSSTGSQSQNEVDMDSEAAAMLTDGMTPFDVLSSVFGATLAPSELEEALANNAYDFERAMSWLVDRSVSSHPPKAGPVRMQSMGNRVVLVSRDGQSGFHRGGRGTYGSFVPPGQRGNTRFVNGRPVQGGNRVCRYFLAGECLRADCRFSHDLERALCRFWLRGTCAKGEHCEFLHHLPQDIDVSALTNAMSRTDLNNNNNGTNENGGRPPSDDFPSLSQVVSAGPKNRRGSQSHGRDESIYQDPTRTRFAAAVKRSAPVVQPPPQNPLPKDPALLAARREAMGPAAELPLHHTTAIVAPKPSPRLRLRPPSLLPTLPTGEAVNNLYMTYRSRALQLGAARNACLSRAADAWRRGDGAAAKRFSREGHDLNAKMHHEMVDAAGKLVRERARVAEQAARSRDANWSDDPGDRTARGKLCGAGLGVILGIASQNIGNDGKKLSPEERTEAMLDLHGLHSSEATEILEEFLLALEREHFYGLGKVSFP
ncbi:hypothetical protein K474DRAFT_1658186 [Panus rudis PR-1116 ss-1]|nr:hypothetical protein K474DRAFT_1658186 [Panus rudis PR-1116 ss-1]